MPADILHHHPPDARTPLPPRVGARIRGRGGCRGAAIDSIERLADGVDDLRRRFDAVGRDWSAIDVVFTNFDGGSPTDEGFNADAYLTGLEKLAALGVTWVQVPLPGDSLAHVRDTIDRFRTLVIDVT